MGFFKNIDIMLHNGDDDKTIAKWIRENAKDPNISKEESLNMAASLRHHHDDERINFFWRFKE
tara:strand:- start:465 stop:653 length:189 start_codon:yes stop_codon:yes gene_type:complete